MPFRSCSPTEDGTASPFAQQADLTRVCNFHSPYGFRALCRQDGDGGQRLSLLRGLPDPLTCHYGSCAVVGSSGRLMGAGHGPAIDSARAVIRVNLAPAAGPAAYADPQRSLADWAADVGVRTTWRVLTMETFSRLPQYSRNLARSAQGLAGRASSNASNVGGAGRAGNAIQPSFPSFPRYAVVCHQPTKSTGRCRADRIRENFAATAPAAAHLVNPLLVREVRRDWLSKAPNQRVPTTGLIAVAFAMRVCSDVRVYGFGDGLSPSRRYHYWRRGGLNETHFFEDPLSTGGFHNFTSNRRAVERMAQRGLIRLID